MEEMNVNTNEVVEVAEEVTNSKTDVFVKLGVTGVVIAGVAALAYFGFKKIKARKNDEEVIVEGYEIDCDEDSEEDTTK